MPHQGDSKSHAEQGPKAAGMIGYILCHGAAQAVCVLQMGQDLTRVPLPVPAERGLLPSHWHAPRSCHTVWFYGYK